MLLINKTDNPSALSTTNKVKFLFRDTLFFGGLSAIRLLFPFITIPILTNYFSVSNYGLYDSMMVLVGFATLFLVFGQDSAVARWFYQVEDNENKKHVVSEALILQIIFASIIIFIIIINSSLISLFYFKEIGYNKYIIIVSIYSFFLLISNFSINILKWTFNRKKYAIISIISPLLLLFSLLTVFYYKLTLYDYILISTIATVLSSLISLYFCRNWLIFPKKFIYLKKLIIYGAPLGVIASTASLMPAIDRKMIISFLNLESLGIYALAYKIAALLTIADSMFQMAWGPFSLSIFKEKDAEKVYNSVIKMYLILFCVLILGLFIITPFIIDMLANESYKEARYIMLPLFFAFLFKGLSGITGIGINLSMKTYFNIIPFVLSTLIFILLLNILIPLYNLQGVVYSLLITNLIQMLIISFLSQKVYKQIKIKYLKVIILSISFFLIFLIVLYLDVFIVIKWLILISVLIILFLFVANTEDKKLLVNYINRIIKKTDI